MLFCFNMVPQGNKGSPRLMNRGLFILTDSVIAGGKGDIPAVSAKIFQQQLGHFVGDLPHDPDSRHSNRSRRCRWHGSYSGRW